MNKVKVLFLAANPKDTPRLQLDEEIRAITQKIRSSKYRDSLELISAWAVRTDDLIQALNEHMPHIVHFSGHGSSKGEIILEDESGVSKPVSQQAITGLFTTLKDNVRVVVFNACYSKSEAQAVTEVIDCTIGMNTAIGDHAAITFAASFYRAIGFGRSIQQAFEQGKSALQLEGIHEDKTPELIPKKGIDPSQIFLIDETATPMALWEKILVWVSNFRGKGIIPAAILIAAVITVCFLVFFRVPDSKAILGDWKLDFRFLTNPGGREESPHPWMQCDIHLEGNDERARGIPKNCLWMGGPSQSGWEKYDPPWPIQDYPERSYLELTPDATKPGKFDGLLRFGWDLQDWKSFFIVLDAQGRLGKGKAEGAPQQPGNFIQVYSIQMTRVDKGQQ